MPLRIRNWRKFQHYSNDNPAWLKLYRDLLDDPEFHSMEPLAAKYLPLLWLACASTQGELPPIDKLAFRLRLSPDVLCSLIPLWEPYLDGDSREYLDSLYSKSSDPSRQIREEERRGEEIRGEEKSAPRKRGRTTFVRPTEEEARGHYLEKGYTFSFVAWWSHYEANGWRVGKNPMKSWHATMAQAQAQGWFQPAPGSNPIAEATPKVPKRKPSLSWEEMQEAMREDHAKPA